MIIGYARVSTADQSLDTQIDAMEKYAAEVGKEIEIYTEKESGGKGNRPVLALTLKALRRDDTFIIYKLDRLARSTRQLYEVTDQLKDKGIEFISLKDNLDTTTAGGRAMFGMMAVFAEFEREIIQERTKAGLEAARKLGNIGGRKPLDNNIRRHIVKLYQSGERAADISKEYGIGRSTVYKILNEAKEEVGLK